MEGLLAKFQTFQEGLWPMRPGFHCCLHDVVLLFFLFFNGFLPVRPSDVVQSSLGILEPRLSLILYLFIL